MNLLEQLDDFWRECLQSSGGDKEFFESKYADFVQRLQAQVAHLPQAEQDKYLIGNLEKLLSLPVADSLGVNVNESEREQSGTIPRQFCGARRVRAIFRGALMPFVT